MGEVMAEPEAADESERSGHCGKLWRERQQAVHGQSMTAPSTVLLLAPETVSRRIENVGMWRNGPSASSIAIVTPDPLIEMGWRRACTHSPVSCIHRSDPLKCTMIT